MIMSANRRLTGFFYLLNIQIKKWISLQKDWKPFALDKRSDVYILKTNLNEKSGLKKFLCNTCAKKKIFLQQAEFEESFLILKFV